jgi:transposase
MTADGHGVTANMHEVGVVSTDPNFAVEVEDIIGLYLDPPERALVLAIDEKSQMQALDRTQPGLPLKKGRAGTMTHDYKRNGTTTLFAALDIATGKVIGECLARHRADEFLAFLRKIDRETPTHLDLHLILDNYATHKTPAVKRWLARHKRFIPHFTPTSCSWLNLVERLFAEITRQRIRRGIFHDVAELEAAIDEWIEHRNKDPKPFTWTATGKTILVKHRRAKKVLAKAGRK